MRKWWRRRDPWEKGIVAYFVVAFTVLIPGLTLDTILDWPGWAGGVVILGGIFGGLLACFWVNAVATRNRRKQRQPRRATSLRHNAKDRNCVRWYGAPVDLSQRCLNCNPKAAVRVIEPYVDDDWDAPSIATLRRLTEQLNEQVRRYR
jgi:hypothetical protein